MSEKLTDLTDKIIALHVRQNSEIHALKKALAEAVEYLRELHGEWKWKDGAGERNSRDFRELEKCIEAVDSLLPNVAISQPEDKA